MESEFVFCLFDVGRLLGWKSESYLQHNSDKYSEIPEPSKADEQVSILAAISLLPGISKLSPLTYKVIIFQKGGMNLLGTGLHHSPPVFATR